MNEYFKQLFDYDIWANRTLLELFEKQFPVNTRIYELMSHMLSAKKIWLERVVGVPQSQAVWSERLPEEIKNDNELYDAEWQTFVEGLSAADYEKKIHYTNSMGMTFDTRLVDIITHVINHGTHHRGNIMTMMKEEGYVLPYLDFIWFVRE